MEVYRYCALHVPTGSLHRKTGEFASELDFHRAIEEYNRQAALNSCRREDRRIWVYFSDRENVTGVSLG